MTVYYYDPINTAFSTSGVPWTQVSLIDFLDARQRYMSGVTAPDAATRSATVADLPDPAAVARAAGGIGPNPKGYTVQDSAWIALVKQGVAIDANAKNRLRALFPALHIPGDAELSAAAASAIPWAAVAVMAGIYWYTRKRR